MPLPLRRPIKKEQPKKTFWESLDLPDNWTTKEQIELEEYMEQFGVKPKKRIRVEDVVDVGLFKEIGKGTAEFQNLAKELKRATSVGDVVKTYVNPEAPMFSMYCNPHLTDIDLGAVKLPEAPKIRIVK